MQPTNRDSIRICQAVVCRLGNNVVPKFESDEDERLFVSRVLQEEGATYEEFRLLDEKPGRDDWHGYEGLHGPWHHRLRRARNNPTTGRDMFKILEENGKARKAAVAPLSDEDREMLFDVIDEDPTLDGGILECWSEFDHLTAERIDAEIDRINGK